MRGLIRGAPTVVHEEALAVLDEAHMRFLAEGDLKKYGRFCSTQAAVARDAGYVNVAESAHREAIQGFNGLDNTIAPESLDEYARLVDTLTLLGGRVAKRKLRSLRDEALAIGPIGQELVVRGIYIVAKAEKELGNLGGFGSRRNARRSRRTEQLCGLASREGGLGLVALSRSNLEPRTVNAWIKDLSANV